MGALECVGNTVKYSSLNKVLQGCLLPAQKIVVLGIPMNWLGVRSTLWDMGSGRYRFVRLVLVAIS